MGGSGVALSYPRLLAAAPLPPPETDHEVLPHRRRDHLGRHGDRRRHHLPPADRAWVGRRQRRPRGLRRPLMATATAKKLPTKAEPYLDDCRDCGHFADGE